MRGRWAQGVEPRDLTWIIPDRMAVCERPGGYGRDHRSVRRKEEIIWIKLSAFTRVVSLMPAPFNIASYEKEELPYLHLPVADKPRSSDLVKAFSAITKEIDDSEVLLLHHEKVGDVLGGFLACYGLWRGSGGDAPRALTSVERLLRRPVGRLGREMVTNFTAPGPSNQRS